MKRKAESHRVEEEAAKRLKLQEEQNKGSLESPTCKTTEAETGVKVENGENQENTMSANGQNGVNEHSSQQKGENSMDENENQNKIKKETEDDGNEIGTPRILFTGFVPSSLAEMERMARELRAEVVTSQNAVKATHMVMPKLGRTMAFLCGITYVKYVLSSQWVEDSSKEKKFLGKKHPKIIEVA